MKEMTKKTTDHITEVNIMNALIGGQRTPMYGRGRIFIYVRTTIINEKHQVSNDI